jgi:hypothetical protein
MSEDHSRRTFLKRSAVTTALASVGLLGTAGSASAAKYGTVIEVEPRTGSSGPQNYEVGINTPGSAFEEDLSLEDNDFLGFEDDQGILAGTVEEGVDEVDKISVKDPESDVVVNRAEEVVVFVNGEAIYP